MSNDPNQAEPAPVALRSAIDALVVARRRRAQLARSAGALAAPLFFVAAFAQATARDGFDIRDHTLSLLSNGRFGWIQVLNFALTGALFAVAALAMRDAYPAIRSMRTTAGLLLTFAIGLIAAGLLRPDPGYGFPPGTPKGAPESMSWHGGLHLLVGGVSFLALSAACFTAARYLTRTGQRSQAICSRLVGGGFIIGFAALGADTDATNVAFIITAVLAFGWASMLTARQPEASTHR